MHVNIARTFKPSWKLTENTYKSRTCYEMADKAQIKTPATKSIVWYGDVLRVCVAKNWRIRCLTATVGTTESAPWSRWWQHSQPQFLVCHQASLAATVQAVSMPTCTCNLHIVGVSRHPPSVATILAIAITPIVAVTVIIIIIIFFNDKLSNATQQWTSSTNITV